MGVLGLISFSFPGWGGRTQQLAPCGRSMTSSRPQLSHSNHALLTMRARKISRRDVRNALRNRLSEEAGTNELEPALVVEGTAMNGQSLYVAVDAKDET